MFTWYSMLQHALQRKFKCSILYSHAATYAGMLSLIGLQNMQGDVLPMCE